MVTLPASTPCPSTTRMAPRPSIPLRVLLLPALKLIASLTVTPPDISKPAAKLMVTPPAEVPSAPLLPTRNTP